VNGTKIPLQEFAQEYERTRRIYQQLGALTPEMEKKLNVRKTVLDNLVNTVLIEQAAKKMGVKVSDEDLRKEIASIPYFQKEGTFNPEMYQQTLKANRLTPAMFEDEKRKEILSKKALQKVKDQVQVSDDELLAAYHKQNDKVDLAFVSFSPADVKGEVKTTEQDLQGYLQGHQEEFRKPEQIRLAYVLVDPAKVTGVTVSEEEANSYYQKNIDRYQGKGGILPFAEVKDRVRADAARNKAAKQAYENAADAINKNMKSGDLAAVASALGSKVAETGFFTAANPPAALAAEPEVVKRAFALKQGELGGPVETAKGVYVVKTAEKQAATVPPLAQVKGEVEKRVKEEKARDLAKKKAEDALAQLAKGGSGLKLQDTGLFQLKDKEVPKIGPAPELAEAAFALTAAAPAAKTPFKIGDRWYAVKLKQRVEAPKEEFLKSKEQIRLEVLPKKQDEAVQKWLKELKEKAKIETNPSVLAD